MKYLAGVFAAILLATIIDHGVARKVKRKPVCKEEHKPMCKDTRVYGDFSNRTLQQEVMRKFILDYWASDAKPELSCDAQDFIDDVLSRNGTDSYSMLQKMFISTARVNIFETIEDLNQPGLCFLAENVNSSVNWAETGNGQVVLDHIVSSAKTFEFKCMSILKESLKATGCKSLPELDIPTQSDCYKNGKVYEFERALKYYGRDLPCSIVKRLRNLYKSCNYVDNLLAVCYVSATTEPSVDLFSVFPFADFLEHQYSRVDYKDDLRCCQQRTDRYTAVCQNIKNTDLSSIVEKYSPPPTECH